MHASATKDLKRHLAIWEKIRRANVARAARAVIMTQKSDLWTVEVLEEKTASSARERLELDDAISRSRDYWKISPNLNHLFGESGIVLRMSPRFGTKQSRFATYVPKNSQTSYKFNTRAVCSSQDASEEASLRQVDLAVLTWDSTTSENDDSLNIIIIPNKLYIHGRRHVESAKDGTPVRYSKTTRYWMAMKKSQ